MTIRPPALWIATLLLLGAPLAWAAPVTGAPPKSVSIGGAAKPKYAGPPSLSLKQAIEIYFKQNLDFQALLLTQESAKITYRQAWRRFYLPTLSLTAGMVGNETLGTLPETPSRLTYPTGRSPVAPTFSVGLAIASPNLFNFFLDRMDYDLAVMNFERTQQKLEEEKRSQSTLIIDKYSIARLSQEQFEATQRSLQIAEVILNLVRSRKALGTADQTEVESAEVDRNDARNALIAARTKLQQDLFELNRQLNIRTDSNWNLTTAFEHKPLNMTFEQAWEIFKERAPAMRDAKISLETAHMGTEQFEKRRMGLPNLTLSGFTAGYSNGLTGGTNAVGDGIINTGFSLTLTIHILNDAGFFSTDAARITRIALETAEIGYRKMLNDQERNIRTTFLDLQKLQEQLLPLQESFNASTKVLDRLVSEMATKKPSRLELRDAIKNAREKEIELLKNVIDFIKAKNNFYVQIGKDLEF